MDAAALTGAAGPAATSDAEAGCCASAEPLADPLPDHPAYPQLTFLDNAAGCLACALLSSNPYYQEGLYARPVFQHLGISLQNSR